MRFPEFTHKSSNLHIEALGESLEFSKNLIFKDGFLQARKGTVTHTDRLLNDSAYREGNSFKYKPLSLTLFTENDTKSLVAEEIDYDSTVFIVLVHILNGDGTPYTSVPISFQRIDSATFYIPQGYVFFKGAPQNGCGVYGLFALVNSENSEETEERIYELSADFDGWLLCSQTYVPTVYINGQGNKYDTAVQTNQIYTENPKYLEKLNILNGQFYAYFSSDGRSSSFRLPFADLDDRDVDCRLYCTVSDYIDWQIPKGQTTATATVYSVEVTMNVDRQSGIVYFTVPSGEYEVPLFTDRNENNLRFFAGKSTKWKLRDLALSVCNESANDRIYLCKGNSVFVANYSNPLYFPLDSALSLGEEDRRITAIKSFKNRPAVFTREDTYLLTLKKGKALNSTSLLADNDRIFYSCDSLEPEILSDTVGCNQGESVISTNNALYWQGTDQSFYRLGSTVTCISADFSDYIKALFSNDGQVFGINADGLQLFIKGSCAVGVNYEDGKTPIWYYFEYPEEIRFTGVLGSQMLLCESPQFGLCFTADISGESDSCLTGEYYSVSVSELPIKSSLKTKALAFGCANTFKTVDEILMNLSCGECKIYLNDRLGAELSPIDSLSFVRLTPGLCAVNGLHIGLESEGAIRLGSVDINYTLLGG